MEPTTTSSVLQALGFATGGALCCLLAALQWQPQRLVQGTRLYSWLWLAGLLWTAGSFAKYVLELSGQPPSSRALAIAELIAWSSTCSGPILVSRLADRELRGQLPFRRLALGLSACSGALLLVLFGATAFIPGFPLRVLQIARLALYNALLHAALYGLVYLTHRPQPPERAPLPAPTRRILWMAAVLLCIEAGATLITIHVPDEFRTLHIVAGVLAQQWVIPAAVLVATSLALQHHADVVLKRSLILVASVVVATLVVWWIPGLPRGIPVVLSSLFAAGLMLAAPSVQRFASWTIDRLVLQRPAYPVLLQAFVDRSQRVANEGELFALAVSCLGDALHLDARVCPAEQSAEPGPSGAERRTVRGAAGATYVVELTATKRARTLLHEEHVFLDALAAEIGRRLETLEFERERRDRQLREERLRHAVTQAELRALRAQLDPHFLFNTLNTIAALIGSDPERAEAMTERMSEFLRYTLKRQDRAFSTLDEELEFVRHYLEIEQVRFGERLRISLSRDAEVAQQLVPTLILQPLVENAVRHGLASKLDGGSIAIRASTEGELLKLEVADSGVGMPPQSHRHAGIGLQNVRERLRVLYRETARMNIRPGAHGRGTCVTLLLPKHDH